MKSGRLPLPQKVIWIFYFIKKLSDKKLNKSGLCPKGLNLVNVNYGVSEASEAAARGLNERIRGPTLVISNWQLFQTGKREKWITNKEGYQITVVSQNV